MPSDFGIGSACVRIPGGSRPRIHDDVARHSDLISQHRVEYRPGEGVIEIAIDRTGAREFPESLETPMSAI